MKIPGDKSNLTLLETLNSSEAVKVSTRSSAQASSTQAADLTRTPNLFELTEENNSDNGISVQFGLAKYLTQELDPEKIRQERLEKIAQIKSKIASGTYLESVRSEDLASKILEEAQVEYLEAGKIAGNE